ncbi:MAG: hypothetical protein GY821_08135, partial [Gammaproteobacteria bacterium]|nr:hypothetical protein [Gammaproteobacteria bacterium]
RDEEGEASSDEENERQGRQNFSGAKDSLKKTRSRKSSSSQDARFKPMDEGQTKSGRVFRNSALDHSLEIQPILKRPPVSTNQHRNNPTEPRGHTSTPMQNHPGQGNGQNFQNHGNNTQQNQGQNFRPPSGQFQHQIGQNRQNFGQNHNRPPINNGTQNQYRTVVIEDDDWGREDDNERQDDRPHPNPNPPPYPRGYGNGYGNDTVITRWDLMTAVMIAIHRIPLTVAKIGIITTTIDKIMARITIGTRINSEIDRQTNCVAATALETNAALTLLSSIFNWHAKCIKFQSEIK